MLQVIVAADVFPKIYLLLRDTDPMVRRNSATVIREVCKHTPELAQLVVATGGVAALVENIRDTVGNERLPGLLVIIFINFFWLEVNCSFQSWVQSWSNTVSLWICSRAKC